MHTYKVLAACFFDGVYRTPGDPRHDPFTREEKIDPLPAHLKEVDTETEATAQSRDAAVKNLSKKIKGQKEEVKGATFMTDPHPDVKKSVETL